MTHKPRHVSLILDTTAISAWCRESIAVGELLAEINDEHGAVIIPLMCLVEAAHLTAMLQADRLTLLLEHPATFVVSDDPANWQALAAVRGLVEKPDLVSAAWLAVDERVPVLTRDGRWYSALAGGNLAIEFDV